MQQALAQPAATAPTPYPPPVGPRPAPPTMPGLCAWPLPLERGLGELAARHGLTGLFGIDYQRARGFARALSEALAAPLATDEEVLERARSGRPLICSPLIERAQAAAGAASAASAASAAGAAACAADGTSSILQRFDRTATAPRATEALALALELAQAFDEGMAIAAGCLAGLAREQRYALGWDLGPGAPRAELYERLFRLARIATGAASRR